MFFQVVLAQQPVAGVEADFLAVMGEMLLELISRVRAEAAFLIVLVVQLCGILPEVEAVFTVVMGALDCLSQVGIEVVVLVVGFILVQAEIQGHLILQVVVVVVVFFLVMEDPHFLMD